jgi:hypothetical protein
MQQLSKDVPVATNIHATIEERFLCGPCQDFITRAVGAMSSERRNTLCGDRVKYLHCDPASRRRRRKGSLKSETVKYGCESQGTRTRERLCCQIVTIL